MDGWVRRSYQWVFSVLGPTDRTTNSVATGTSLSYRRSINQQPLERIHNCGGGGASCMA